MKEQQNKGIGCLAVIIVAILALIVFGTGNNNTDKDSIPEEYDWVVGIWTCNTPFGTKTFSLGRNGSFSDNEGHEGTYTIDSGRILTHLKGTMGYAIEMDERNQRIGPGGEYWMTKVFN